MAKARQPMPIDLDVYSLQIGNNHRLVNYKQIPRSGRQSINSLGICGDGLSEFGGILLT